MPNISKIKLPSGIIYDIYDAVARDAMAGGLNFRGVTTTVLTDGASTSSYKIGSNTISASNGDFVVYNSKEFIFSTADNKWHELGDNSAFKALAYKDSATGSYTPAGTVSKPTFTGSSSDVSITATTNTSGNYQPAGTVSKPTFTGTETTFTGSFTPHGSVSVSTGTTEDKTATVAPLSSGTATYTPGGSVTAPTISVVTAGTTTTIKNPGSKTVMTSMTVGNPSQTAIANAIVYYEYDQENEMLTLKQIGYNTGASISTSNVTVKTGDATYSASAPEFSGNPVRLVTGKIPVPSSYTASFTGTEEDVSTKGTPLGNVSQPTFSGTKVQLAGTTTAAGTISQPTFTGTDATITVS